MLRSANLESRQSMKVVKESEVLDAPLREFGIKAKLEHVGITRQLGCSAPRIWNQGKAHRGADRWPRGCSAPRIWNQGKAERRVCPSGLRCSAPRIWNQGKAPRERSGGSRSMLRSANLESRQSATPCLAPKYADAPLREFGIKAKHRANPRAGSSGCSAPRIWNQGKAMGGRE